MAKIYIPIQRRDESLPEFDSDLSPSDIRNKLAADARGLKYNPPQGAYLDADGCLIRDRFGQEF